MGNDVFNYLDDLIFFSRSVQERATHVRVVLKRLENASFILNPDKIVIRVAEIKYVGHLLSSRGISVLTNRVAALKAYPRLTNLRTLRRFVGMTGF